MHKRRVGAVLQQPAHQVGQQVAVRTHWGIDAAGYRGVLQHLAVQPLAHAVQALQLKRRTGTRCHLDDGGNGGRVVAGKLRVNGIRRVQQRPRTRQVGHIGMVLVGEHRVGGQTQFLGALDFCVPIGTLHQAAHQAQVVAPRQRDGVRYEFERTRLIGLHRHAKALPLRAVQRHLVEQRVKHLKGELLAVHFLGIDGQVDVGRRCLFAQAPDTGHQLGHDALALRILKARVQGAELDRDAIVILHSARPACVSSYGFNSGGVTLQVT